MSLIYGFYNAELKNGTFDRTYDAEDFGKFFDGIMSDGVFKNYGNAFKVTKTGNNTVTVDTGKAWLNGTWNVLEAPQSFKIGTAPLYAIILTVNKKARTNFISIKECGNEVTLTRDETNEVYQYCLAYIRVANGVITSVESHIGRGTENVTPWATGLIGGGSGGAKLEASAYTTGIKFKGTTGFDLTFKDTNGLSYVNNFKIVESGGKITKIINNSTGRSIVISYE